ncbi:MAG: tetratricopeptide repeat protein [Wolbachia endosymbiont of Homalodisca vitripennis]|nr:tetratricopeptide repeat protein [Wolbachia endosymbiont of Homalodisca vitripennis]
MQVESTPKRSRDERKRDEEDSSPEQQRYKFSKVVKGINMPQSGDREDVPIPKTSTVKCEDMMGKTTMPSEFISSLGDQRLNNRSILLPRKEYFFLTRKGGGIPDSNFSDIEKYCKKGEYDNVVSSCEGLIGLEGAVNDEVILKGYYNKGEALFVQGKYEDAIQVLEKTLNLTNLRKKDYQQISFARLIAEICCKAGKYDKAISILKDMNCNSDENLNALIDKDIKEIKNIQTTRPSTSMSGIESEKHMVEGKKK